MIISGYQGIGKSTLAGKDNCIDLESSNFWEDYKRPDDWYKIYCNIAIELSKQGYIVFVSSHEKVRRELEKSNQLAFAVFPSLHLRDEWVRKLEKRYEESNLYKDYKAYKNAEDHYKENIMEIMRGNLTFYEITKMDYDLKDIVEFLKTKSVGWGYNVLFEGKYKGDTSHPTPTISPTHIDSEDDK